MDHWKQIFIYGRIRTDRGTGNLQQIRYTASKKSKYEDVDDSFFF